MAREPFAARLICIWTGALFWLLFKGGKGGFQQQLARQYEGRNFWTGFIVQLALLALFIFLVIKARQH